MILRIVTVCALLLTAVLALYASTSHATRADFVYVNPSGIHTLDPARMSWTQDFRVALNIWEGLTTSHPKTSAPMEGAAHFPPQISKDGLTVTFSIRDDAKWSNGDRVTAHDFLRGWRRAMEPGTAADYLFFFTDYINGAKEYVRWRSANVKVLAALRRLAGNGGIEPVAAKALVRHRIYEEISRQSPSGLEAPDDPDDVGWAAFGRTLPTLPLDWSSLADRCLEQHARDIDLHFAGVGMEAVDTATLRVRLTKTCPFFLDLAAFPTLLPCHESIERLRRRYHDLPLTAEGLVVYDPQWTKPDYSSNGYPGLITNGAYRVADWQFKRRLRLAVNPFYRDAADLGCQTIDMVVYENVSASMMAYEAGDVDFLPAMDVPYDHELARLARTGERPDFHLCRTLATFFLNFNCESDTVGDRVNPFTDARVRRAFTLATDRTALVDKVLGRGDRIARSFVPPDAIEGYEPPSGLPYDPDAARQWLAGTGYADGAFPVVEILYVPSDALLCQALARMWERELGVRVELRAMESKTFAEAKSRQRFMVARGNWYADYYDPTTFLDCLIGDNGNNDSRYRSARYDDLMAQASTTRDPRRRASLLRSAERLIVEEDCPILPVLHYAQPIAIQPWVKGLYPNARLRFPFQYVTVER